MMKPEIERAPSVPMSRSARLALAAAVAFAAWFVQTVMVEGFYPVRLARESVRISRIYHDAVVADVKATLQSRQSIGIDDASRIIDTFLTNNIASIRALTEPAKPIVEKAFTNATNDVFLSCLPFILAALIVVLFLKELPLRTGAAKAESSDVPTVGH